MSNDKLAALLRECLADYSHPHFTDRGGMADRIRAALQAHAAEAVQAQAQSGECQRNSPAGCDCIDTCVAISQPQAVEPVRQFRVAPKGSVWTDVKDPEIWASVTAHPESYETRVLYTHPQPAQDASKYAPPYPDQSDEWAVVPRVPTKAMIDACCKIKLDRLEALRDGHGASSGIVAAAQEEWAAMIAAAPRKRHDTINLLEDSTAKPPAARVTDAMVEDGCVAWNKSAGLGYAVADRDCMRAAIEAALAAQENPNG